MRAGHRMRSGAARAQIRPSRTGKPSAGRGRHAGRRSLSRPGHPKFVQVLVRQIGPLVGGEVTPVTHSAQPPAIDDAHAPWHPHAGVGRLAGLRSEGWWLECEAPPHPSTRALLRCPTEVLQEVQHGVRPPERPGGQAPEVGRVVKRSGREQQRVQVVEGLQIVGPHPDVFAGGELHHQWGLARLGPRRHAGRAQGACRSAPASFGAGCDDKRGAQSAQQ